MGGLFGGGGSAPAPAPAPASQTVTQTSIPSYAQPYVEEMLGKSQALTDINQNPYQQYQGERIAGFSPMQQQAFSNIANQTTAPQIGTATGLAGISGLGSLGTAGQMAGAGRQYERMATDPYAVQAYMNPYLQASLQPQLNLLAQQAGIQSAAQQSAATQAGAFGGSRSALANALQQQNALLAQQQAIGQGYNQAFNQAQQAQQFRANLGLQGLQGALSGYGQAGQAAGTLGQLGQTQFGQQQAINAAQQQAGAVQQAQAQQGLDVAYQNFLAQKNYPYTQLAFMSDMLRGLPLSQSSQQIYQAPPNLGSQLGGLGMTALGIYGMSGGFGKKRGGKIKEMNKGGIASYSVGGDISMMDTKQLEQLLNDPRLDPMEEAEVEKQLMLRRRMEMNPETEQIMAGIGAIPTGDMVPAGAGGGIVAFAKGGESDDIYADYEKTLMANIKKRQAAMDQGDPFAESKASQAKIQAQLDEINRTSPFRGLAAAGLSTMAGTSPYLARNIGLGGLEGLKSYAQSKAEADQLNKLMLEQNVEREKSQFARQAALLGSEQTALGQFLGRRQAAESTAAAREATAATRESTLLTRAQTTYNSLYNNAYDNLVKSAKPGGPNYKKYKDDPDALATDARTIATSQLSPDLAKILGQVQAPATPKPKATTTKTYPPATPAAISALKSRKDVDVAKQQFDAIFGPGAADKALGK